MSWKKVNSPKIEHFLIDTEDATLTVIKSGFEGQYHLVHEIAYETHPTVYSHTFTKEMIQEAFGIEISI